MPVTMQRRSISIVSLAVIVSACSAGHAGGQVIVPRTAAGDVQYVGYIQERLAGQANGSGEDVKFCYGPCNGCAPKTLFQWSHCASFTGGPDLEEPIVTDRPDFTEATSTVGLGVIQLEFGYTYVYDSEPTGTFRAHSYPETLLRVGTLAEWLEFRLAFNYLEESTRTFGVGRSLASGAEDIEVGFKIGLTPQEGFLPEMSLIPLVSVPTGSSNFTADEVLPGLNWNYGWDINEIFSTAGQSRFDRAIDDVTGEEYLQYAQSWTVGYSLGERVGAYTEWFALIPSGADTNPTQHFANGGFTFLVHNDLQLDVRGGFGLNDAAEDYFLGTGGAVRY